MRIEVKQRLVHAGDLRAGTSSVSCSVFASSQEFLLVEKSGSTR